MQRNMLQLFIIIALLFFLDLYIYQAVKTVMADFNPATRKIIFFLYWLVGALTLAAVLSMPWLRSQVHAPAWRVYPFAILIGILIAKLLSVSFFLVDDLRRALQWVFMQFSSANSSAVAGAKSGEAISRSTFLSWLGFGVGGSVFATLLFGFKNQYNYQVRTIKMVFKDLPAAFKGLKIAHISDIHSGSFMDTEEVLRGIETINGLSPDVILFTGDLVNDRAGEMEPYTDIFSRLSAPMGVFSTLGNHDYGDYAQWKSKEEKQENLEKLKQTHALMGWRLLMDESVLLEKDGEKIGLIGVQNISGKSSFHSYGNLPKAYADTAAMPFKILMSHDPSHWDAEVRKNYPDINLTLSGHTHGMQFGVELPWFRWSPVQWMYRQWAGLYEEGEQRLYVNRGFGFIGYPGRVGILPEITLIELA
jgi:predicted MPP superfamily phosphohydrolase